MTDKKLFWVIVQSYETPGHSAKPVRAIDSDDAIRIVECEHQGRCRILGVVDGKNADTAWKAIEEFEKTGITDPTDYGLPLTPAETRVIYSILAVAVAVLLAGVLTLVFANT